MSTEVDIEFGFEGVMCRDNIYADASRSQESDTTWEKKRRAFRFEREGLDRATLIARANAVIQSLDCTEVLEGQSKNSSLYPVTALKENIAAEGKKTSKFRYRCRLIEDDFLCTENREQLQVVIVNDGIRDQASKSVGGSKHSRLAQFDVFVAARAAQARADLNRNQVLFPGLHCASTNLDAVTALLGTLRNQFLADKTVPDPTPSAFVIRW